MPVSPLKRVFLPGLLLGLLGAAVVGCNVKVDTNPPSNPTSGAGGTAEPPPPGAEGYLFCFWNMENLFDDHLDGRDEPDKAYDEWFAQDAEARKEKYDHLSRVLAALNGGRGPDILACAELETTDRTVELLRDALNAHIKDPAYHYKSYAMKDPRGGRDIATAVLSRVPIVGDRTHLLGKRQRILEVHLKANGHELVVIASHWTSRVSDKSGDGRDKYADTIYGEYRAMFTDNPKVDLLICGDFNDNPDDDSVRDNLHATGDAEKVKKSTKEAPLLYDLMAEKWAANKGKELEQQEFTHVYGTEKYMFDQLVVSPGMLDRSGWSCDPKSVEIIANEHTTEKRVRGKIKTIPWRFGNRHDKFERGCSDHLPVTVRLHVAR